MYKHVFSTHSTAPLNPWIMNFGRNQVWTNSLPWQETDIGALARPLHLVLWVILEIMFVFYMKDMSWNLTHFNHKASVVCLFNKTLLILDFWSMGFYILAILHYINFRDAIKGPFSHHLGSKWFEVRSNQEV